MWLEMLILSANLKKKLKSSVNIAKDRIFIFQFIDIGVVSSIELNHKQIEAARKGQEVCIKIESVGGDAPKMFGRHFDETDLLVSKVSSWF